MLKTFLPLFLLAFSFLSAQASVLDKRLSVEFSAIPLSQALEKIEQLAGITFSYKSTDIEQNKTITLKVVDGRVYTILTRLLDGQNVCFTALGQMVVLHRGAKKKDKIATRLRAPLERVDNRNETSPCIAIPSSGIKKQKNNAASYRDTILIYDTIIIYDTVRRVFYDTIARQQKKTRHIFKPSYYTFGVHGGRYMEFAPEETVNSLQRINEGNQYTTEVVCLFGGQMSRWQLETGLGYAYQTNKYSYQEINVTDKNRIVFKTVDYFDIDSIYFVLNTNDTIWSIIKEPKQREEHTIEHYYDSTKTNHSGQHAAHQLLIPIRLSLQAKNTSKFTIILHAEINMGFAYHQKSIFYSAKSKTFADNSSLVFNPMIGKLKFSASFGYKRQDGWAYHIAPVLSWQLSKQEITNSISEFSPLGVGIVFGVKKIKKN